MQRTFYLPRHIYAFISSLFIILAAFKYLCSKFGSVKFWSPQGGVTARYDFRKMRVRRKGWPVQSEFWPRSKNNPRVVSYLCPFVMITSAACSFKTFVADHEAFCYNQLSRSSRVADWRFLLNPHFVGNASGQLNDFQHRWPRQSKGNSPPSSQIIDDWHFTFASGKCSLRSQQLRHCKVPVYSHNDNRSIESSLPSQSSHNKPEVAEVNVAVYLVSMWHLFLTFLFFMQTGRSWNWRHKNPWAIAP